MSRSSFLLLNIMSNRSISSICFVLRHCFTFIELYNTSFTLGQFRKSNYSICPTDNVLFTMVDATCAFSCWHRTKLKPVSSILNFVKYSFFLLICFEKLSILCSVSIKSNACWKYPKISFFVLSITIIYIIILLLLNQYHHHHYIKCYLYWFMHIDQPLRQSFWIYFDLRNAAENLRQLTNVLRLANNTNMRNRLNEPKEYLHYDYHVIRILVSEPILLVIIFDKKGVFGGHFNNFKKTFRILIDFVILCWIHGTLRGLSLPSPYLIHSYDYIAKRWFFITTILCFLNFWIRYR